MPCMGISLEQKAQVFFPVATWDTASSTRKPTLMAFLTEDQKPLCSTAAGVRAGGGDVGFVGWVKACSDAEERTSSTGAEVMGGSERTGG